ncbi:MAG: hypothetical protein L3J19_05095 [Sulfurimonas sp.]|nr:hypothetical protein [Sulfurimonas sp.]
MEEFLYPASLILLVLLAFTFNRTNNGKMALIMILIGIYIVYSHETGDSATDWKNEMVETMDKSVGNYSGSHNIDEFDENKAKESAN